MGDIEQNSEIPNSTEVISWNSFSFDQNYNGNSRENMQIFSKYICTYKVLEKVPKTQQIT